MKSIFVVLTILVILVLLALLYWDQTTRRFVTEVPILPGIQAFRGPTAPPPKSVSAPAATSTKGFFPQTFIGPAGNKPHVVGPPGLPPTQ